MLALASSTNTYLLHLHSQRLEILDKHKLTTSTNHLLCMLIDIDHIIDKSLLQSIYFNYNIHKLLKCHL
jgi:hypothetical protein